MYYRIEKNKKNGLPQDTSSFVTLFLVGINNITSTISFPQKILLFADNLIYFKDKKHK